MTSNTSAAIRSSTTSSRDDSFSEALSSRAYYIWRTYQSFVRQHQAKLRVADGVIHRLLFWLPHHDHSGDGSSSVSPPWREVLYGLLSVNQLAMHCCQQERIENSYGFSIRTRNEPDIPATLLRISLNVIHCLMPSLLELVVRTSNNHTTPQNIIKDKARWQAQLRLRLEQLKCAIRLYLLYSYWNQYTQQAELPSSSPSSKNTGGTTLPGIMLDGGMYQQPKEEPTGISEKELKSRERRRNYRGRRTGLGIDKEESFGISQSPRCWAHIPESSSTTTTKRKILLAELLYTLRPVCWAAAEARYAVSQQNSDPSSSSLPNFRSDPLFQSWIMTLGMELVSLGLLSGERRRGNPFSKEEWNRRRMKVFLYLLRAPVWNHCTSPTVNRFGAMARQVPLIGGLFDSYIWDWILYWKHPYVSEEG